MATLPSNYSRRYNKSRRSHSPPILSPSFPLHHSFSKQPIILSSVAFYSTHFSLSFKELQSFNQSIHHHLLREKNSCNMRTSNGRKRSLSFSNEECLKRRTRILAKAIFFTLENSLGEKMKNGTTIIRKSARIDKAFHSSIHLIIKFFICWLKAS